MKCTVTPTTSDDATWPALMRWAHRSWPRSLHILADATAPLIAHSRFWVARHHSDGIVGAAVRFTGFSRPYLSVAACDAEAFTSLIDAGRPAGTYILSAFETPSPIDAQCQTDFWLRAECRTRQPIHRAEPVLHLEAVAGFYTQHGYGVWSRAMIGANSFHGVRDDEGRLVSLGGVQFVIPEHSYAHVGGLVTAAAHRRRGYANTVLTAIENDLCSMGIRHIGLLADAEDAALLGLYRRRGYAAVDHVHFWRMPGATEAISP